MLLDIILVTIFLIRLRIWTGVLRMGECLLCAPACCKSWGSFLLKTRSWASRILREGLSLPSFQGHYQWLFVVSFLVFWCFITSFDVNVWFLHSQLSSLEIDWVYCGNSVIEPCNGFGCFIPSDVVWVVIIKSVA